MPREPHWPHTAWNLVLWKPKVPQTGQDRKGVPRQERSSRPKAGENFKAFFPMSVFSPLTQQRCPSNSKLAESIRKYMREWPRVAADPWEGVSNAGVLWGPGWQLCDRKQILYSQSWDLIPLQVTWEEPQWVPQPQPEGTESLEHHQVSGNPHSTGQLTPCPAVGGQACRGLSLLPPQGCHPVVSGHRSLVSHWPQRKELI